MVNSFKECHNSTMCDEGQQCVRVSRKAPGIYKKAVKNHRRGKASEIEDSMIKNCRLSEGGCCFHLQKGWKLVDLPEKPKSVKSTKKKGKKRKISYYKPRGWHPLLVIKKKRFFYRFFKKKTIIK